MSADTDRVLMLTTDRHIDRRILLEADSLEQHGWSVTIVAMPLDVADPNEDPRVVRIGALGPAGRRREAAVVRIYAWLRRALPMNSFWMRRLRAALWFGVVDPETFFVRLFAATVDALPAGVFVAHGLAVLPVAARAAADRGARLVYDSHELHVEQELTAREKRVWQAIEARYIGRCDVVITVNQSIAAELQRRYGIDDVRVIQNAERVPDPAPAKGRLFHECFALPERASIVLYQGGMPAGRNLDVLVRAIVHLQSPGVHLVMLGDGMLVGRLQRLARRIGAGDRVHFHPAVAQHELLEYTASADLGVIPYQPTCENNRLCTPNKLFEYVAAGLPMVATDLPELRRLVVGHSLGVVGDTSGPTALARLIDGVLREPGLLDRLRRQVEVARSHLNWQTESDVLLSIYRELRTA